MGARRLETELVAVGVDFRVVGGATGADLDIVISRREVTRLVSALERIGCPEVPAVRSILSSQPCRVITAFGPLDVFVEET